MAEEAAEVARRCSEAKETGRLSLAACGLRKFPDAIFFLIRGAELRAADISRNSLSRIPAKLAQSLSTITCMLLSIVQSRILG